MPNLSYTASNQMALDLALGAMPNPPKIKSDENSAPRLQIQEVWLRPFDHAFRPIIEDGQVRALRFGPDDLIAPGHWTRLSCQAHASILTLPQQLVNPNAVGVQDQNESICVRMRLMLLKAEFEILIGLALPYRHRFLVIVRLTDGHYYLCPYDRGITVLSQLWLSGPNADQCYRADLIGHGNQNLICLADDVMPLPKAYAPNQSLVIDWGRDMIPLQMIAEASLNTLG